MPTSYTKPTVNTATYTKPKRSGRVMGAKFDSGIFDESKFDEPDITYTTYTKPTANIATYTKPAQS